MVDAIEFWGSIAFISLVVWPVLYVLVDRPVISDWIENKRKR